MDEAAKAQVIVISGPSGVGKSTVLEKLLARMPEKLHRSTSATTRPPRTGEIDGKHYYFLPLEEFQQKREAGEFLEYSEVFGRGHWYGTLLQEVTSSLKAGKSVILEIDVDGKQQVVRHYPEAITIFIEPKSWEGLQHQLRNRGTDSPAAVQRRLEVARHELDQAPTYKYQVVNNTVDDAVANIVEILRQCGVT